MRIVNGTAYQEDTPMEVIEVLERCRLHRIRVRLAYGDTVTGADWHETNDVTGYIGRSAGPDSKIPILLYNDRSLGGRSRSR
ncbi:hypothetical protein [Sulfobacillus thermosulfidooxidans]|uniref:hypothetical protein n=1 Tax=Sulfobacillus thermosulfidooxidans TaxID=28034 RepID=UPI0006B5D5D0|nr:hypothetical protein [Sulfobacillus thermosulfidooxidans]